MCPKADIHLWARLAWSEGESSSSHHHHWWVHIAFWPLSFWHSYPWHFFVTSVWKEGHKDIFVSLYAIFYADSIVDCAVSPGSDQSAVPPRKQAGSRAGRLSRTYFAKISVESFYQSAFKLATRDGILTRSHVAFLPMWVCFNRFHSISVADKKKNDAQRYQLQEEVNCPAKCARSMMQHSEMHHSVWCSIVRYLFDAA